MPHARGHARRPAATLLRGPGPLWQPLPTVDTAAASVVMSLTPLASSWPGRGSTLPSRSRCQLTPAAACQALLSSFLRLLGAGHMAPAWQVHVLSAVPGTCQPSHQPYKVGRGKTRR